MQMAAQEILAQFRLNQNLKIALIFFYFFEGENVNAKGTPTLRYHGCPLSCFHAFSMRCPSQSTSYIEQPAATNSQAYSAALPESCLVFSSGSVSA